MARILLIEDDPNALEMLTYRFKKAGYEVDQALDGEAGLDRALHKPDLILLDVRIPKMNGWELCKLLKKEPRTEKIPILMLTGCSQIVQEEYGKACGADAYLTKPWDPEILMDMTRGLLKKVRA